MPLPAIFDPIVNAPKPQKIVLGVVGLGIIIGAAYFLMLSPLQIQVGQLRAQNESLQRELVQSRAIAAEIDRYRREVVELEVKINVLKDKLPTEREMPAFYRSMSDAGIQAGLGVSLFQPRDGVTKDYVVEIPITVNAEGSYHQLGEFLERVARLPRVASLRDMKLGGQKKPGSPVRAELTLVTYTYRPVGSPPAPKSTK
jgi:type IV pilus assembly protein PilO